MELSYLRKSCRESGFGFLKNTLICSSMSCGWLQNFLRINSQSRLSNQSAIRRVPPIQRLHLGHLRADNSKSLSKHSRHKRWSHFSLTGSFNRSMQMGQSRSSRVKVSKLILLVSSSSGKGVWFNSVNIYWEQVKVRNWRNAANYGGSTGLKNTGISDIA